MRWRFLAVNHKRLREAGYVGLKRCQEEEFPLNDGSYNIGTLFFKHFMMHPSGQ